MRDTSQLHALLQAKLELLKSACEKEGLKIGIGECLRTVTEQDALYAKGRTTSGSIVTNAKGSSYSSMHQWGVAFDFYRNDGKGAYENKDKFFQKVGKIGQSIGLEWGGSWKSITDLPHFQLPYWGSTTSKLKSAYNVPATFFKTWFSVGDKVTCTTSVYIFSKLGTKAKYNDLPNGIKAKAEKQEDGTAKFVKGKTFNIQKIAFYNGQVYGLTKSGYYMKLIDSDGNYKFK